MWKEIKKGVRKTIEKREKKEYKYFNISIFLKKISLTLLHSKAFAHTAHPSNGPLGIYDLILTTLKNKKTKSPNNTTY